MPWVSKRHGHRCHPPTERPLFRRVETGDIWKCWRCGTEWRLTLYPGHTDYILDWREVG